MDRKERVAVLCNGLERELIALSKRDDLISELIANQRLSNAETLLEELYKLAIGEDKELKEH